MNFDKLVTIFTHFFSKFTFQIKILIFFLPHEINLFMALKWL